MPILLASASPRRRELLEGIGADFALCPAAGLDESAILASLLAALPAAPTVNDIATALERLALAKGEQVSKDHPAELVLSADTEVLLDGECLGKPADADAACRMLARLSGRWHAVVTAIALQRAEPALALSAHALTTVRFATLSERQIRRYVELEQPFDKAGSYAIQGRGALIIERIEGDYSNVVGLPLGPLSRLLEQAGISLL